MQDDPTVDYYRRRAGEYEKIYYREIPERRKEIDDEADRLRELVKGKSVLELACGTGYWTKVMSETASSIVASDIWMEMLDQAKKKEYRIPVQFIRADMFSHPFREDAFDVVVVGFWFSHQPKQLYEHFYDVITRPLKKDGRVWLIDNNPPAEGTKHEFEYEDEWGNAFKRRYLENGEQHVILKNYFSEEELRKIFSERFGVESLVYGKYYWSVVLANKST